VKTDRIFLLLALTASLCAAARGQQAAPAAAGNSSAAPVAGETAIRRNIEQYLRNLYAWGPQVKLTVGPLKESGITGLLETTVELIFGEQKDIAKVFVSRDGKYMVRGEVDDITRDPAADARAKIKIDGAPSTGDPKAPITLVEFADFQCPVCKQLHDTLAAILPKYPQARLVFKDFPLTQIHAWAKTASVAAHCAEQQDPKAFWKFYDLLYRDQQVISAENAWDKMLDYAAQTGLDTATFKTCLSSTEAVKQVDDSAENGRLLDVNSTPTLFVNGRRMIGADPNQVEQFIRYELDRLRKDAAKKL